MHESHVHYHVIMNVIKTSICRCDNSLRLHSGETDKLRRKLMAQVVFTLQQNIVKLNTLLQMFFKSQTNLQF